MKMVAVAYAPTGVGGSPSGAGVVGAPSLAAFGPTVATGVLDAAGVASAPRGRLFRLTSAACQSLVATTVGALVLLAPMVALAVAVDQVGGGRSLTATQSVPATVAPATSTAAGGVAATSTAHAVAGDVGGVAEVVLVSVLGTRINGDGQALPPVGSSGVPSAAPAVASQPVQAQSAGSLTPATAGHP